MGIFFDSVAAIGLTLVDILLQPRSVRKMHQSVLQFFSLFGPHARSAVVTLDSPITRLFFGSMGPRDAREAHFSPHDLDRPGTDHSPVPTGGTEYFSQLPMN